MIPPPPRTFRKYCAQSEKTATSPSCKQITQPSGAATPRNSDAHKRIAVPKAFCVLWEHPRPSSKSSKTCRSDTRSGDVGERAERSESSDTTPTSHVQKVLHTERKKQQHHQIANRVAQPSGAATPRNSDAHKRIAVPKALCVLWEYPRPRPKSGKTCRSDTRPGDVRERAERSEGSDTTPVRNAPVSPCVPLCAIFRRKTSVYPISPVKANVGRLCEKLKNAMKSGLEQRCGGNFLTIFARKVLSEKPNFLSRIFGRRRPFD